MDVGAHYLLKERWAEIQKLKDEDLVEAIELVELVLSKGADEHEENAVNLVKELREKQSQISGNISRANDYFAASEPEEALKEWRTVLKIVPKHRISTEKVKALEAMLKEEHQRIEQAKEEQDCARFESAESLLEECLGIFPERKRTKELLADCRRRAEQYPAAFNEASSAAKEKMLRTAEKHLKVALSFAPKSSEALSLKEIFKERKPVPPTSRPRARLSLGRAVQSSCGKYPKGREFAV